MLLNNKKIHLILSFYLDNRFIRDFKGKAKLFNFFFLNNAPSFPMIVHFLTTLIILLKNAYLLSHFQSKSIQNLDSNKVYGHDNISIRMLKICGDSIYEPLEIIFRQAPLTDIFPSEWKKGNIVPVHKKSDKQNIQNYRPVSLLPICGKIFERLIFNEIYKFLPLVILFH